MSFIQTIISYWPGTNSRDDHKVVNPKVSGSTSQRTVREVTLVGLYAERSVESVTITKASFSIWRNVVAAYIILVRFASWVLIGDDLY